MDADGKPRLGPEPLDARRLRGLLLVSRLEDHQDALEARLLRARDDGVEVGGEGLVGEMTVAVDHVFHWRSGPLAGTDADASTDLGVAQVLRVLGVHAG